MERISPRFPAQLRLVGSPVNNRRSPASRCVSPFFRLHSRSPASTVPVVGSAGRLGLSPHGEEAAGASHPVSPDGMMRGVDLQPVRLFCCSSDTSPLGLVLVSLRQSVFPGVIACVA